MRRKKKSFGNNGRKTLKSLAFLFYAVVFSTLGLAGWFPGQASAFSGGSGTSGSPYQITTAAELASLSSYLGSGNSGKYFKVMNDIDLNVSPYNTGTGWTPIGTSSSASYFYGKFDGNFKTISGLYYNNSSGSYVGLFGTIGNTGTVSNILLSNATVSGNLEVGSLAGASYGTITKSGVTGGSVTGIQRIGGLVGSNYGTMTYDYSNNSVFFNPTSSPTCCAGGLIGEAYSSGTINNSYSRSSITMTYNAYNQGAVGGLYGNDYSSGAKSNLYSTGAITMVSGSFPASTGGLAGSNYTSTSSSYWDTQTSGWATSSGGAGVAGKTTAQMKTQATYSGWDFSTVWAIDGTGTINNGYPYLQWQITDLTAPTISGISSDTANGSYGVGIVIDIDVTFSETVTSTGSVTVTLETGSVDRTCTFTVTSATTATCNYTVQAGDETADLTVLSIAGTIIDTSANAMSNFVPATNLAANKALVIDTTAPITPGTPSTTSPTTTATPTWTWTASTDATSGLASPAYTTYWSQSATFSSGVSAATSTTNNYTIGSPLADGTWYFRVLASDLAGNNSSFSSTGSVVIDTAPPVSANAPASTNLASNSTPTWAWGAYVDTGLGLAAVPYVLEWSQDSNFVTGVSSTTSATASFTHITKLANGTWYFRVKAIDLLGNTSAYSSAASININAASASVPLIIQKPLDSSAGSSQNTALPIITEQLLNDFQSYTSGAGKKIELVTSQKVLFKVEAETHTAVLEEVGGDYAVLVLHSDPVTVRLNVGETRSYDVNHDGRGDVSITLSGIKNGVAQLVFAQINNKTPVELLPPGSAGNHVVISWLIWILIAAMALIAYYAARQSRKDKFNR